MSEERSCENCKHYLSRKNCAEYGCNCQNLGDAFTLLPRLYYKAIAFRCKYYSPKPEPTGFEKAYNELAGNWPEIQIAEKMYTAGKADERRELIVKVLKWAESNWWSDIDGKRAISGRKLVDFLESLESEDAK